MKTLLSACACTILLLAGPAQAGLFSKDKNNPNDADPNAVLTVADFVKVSGKGKLTGIPQVAIPNFFVQFVRDQTIERKGRMGTDSYTTQVRGIDNATLQTIADALYDGFVEEFKAAGIEVIATETLEATKDFADIRKAARVSPDTAESSSGGGKRDERHQGVSILVSARNLPINVRNTIDGYWLNGNASDGFMVTLGTAPMKVLQELKAPMLDVRLTVAFSAIKGSVSNSGGGSYQVGTAATATNASTTSFKFDADFYPRFVNGGNLVALMTTEGGTIYSLSKPVIIKDLDFTTEKGTGGGSRGSGILGAIERAVGGQADMDADAYIDLKAEDFSAKMTARGREIAHLFVEALTH